MKQCSKCCTMIPVFAIVCPNCTRDIGSSGGDTSDAFGSLLALGLIAWGVYWIYSKVH